MQGQCSITVLAVVILLFGISEGKNDFVAVNENSVNLTCPFDEPVVWYKGTNGNELGKNKTHTLSANNGISKGLFRCEANNKKHYFYVNVRVCGDCIDLGMGTVIGIICGDLLFTLLVVTGVYCFAKKRGGHSKANQKWTARCLRQVAAINQSEKWISYTSLISKVSLISWISLTVLPTSNPTI
ncbi:T-cell surface glycoprotein CD3 delta chain-like isoform X1 [Hemiscyllium ocellatum]|uniref:T-cell surface glycoprotein CD3 delta chain-like isoform X1 n=1 Tax=Hemiscyllium ocellatum TaxID=170820 RepID=UPI002966EB34|nr:T-cell surface glycoprotein CD3 delta chain-like isoform X1 [Hemiscyllium ocellatum]